jgi:uncharacterized protein YggE
MLSVPAAATTARKSAIIDPADKGSVIGDPSALKVTCVVGISSNRLKPRPKTSTHVTTLMRSR